MLGLILSSIFVAFLVGAMARFAVPGPDPMPAWLTIVIGLVATSIGSVIVIAFDGRHPKDVSWVFTLSVFIAIVLVLLYRYFVQKRPLWGKGAYRFPERGFGVEQYRERLRKVGIDPDEIGAATPFGTMPGMATQPQTAPAHDDPGDPTENPAHYLGLLEELHDSGVLDDAEYDGARMRLLERLR